MVLPHQVRQVKSQWNLFYGGTWDLFYIITLFYIYVFIIKENIIVFTYWKKLVLRESDKFFT